MANLSVTATAAVVPGTATQKNDYTVQNLGPDVVYFGRTNAVTAANGVKLDVGGALNVRGGRGVWLVCDTGDTADVRYEQVT